MRPRSAVESWVSVSSKMPQISGRIDLMPVTQGLTIVPQVKSTSRTSQGQFSRRNTLKSESASSVQSVADENLSLVDIENLLLERVKYKKDDLKAAFEAFDQEGNKTVTKGEFRRVIEGFLIPLTESQFDGLLAELDLKENGTIPYMEFLRRYCKVSSAVGRIQSRCGSYRNLSLGELQCRLKNKIGGNLKNITRAFRLFDYNNDGQIQQLELRKVLEGYCFHMSQLEFHRLWSHYSVNNADTISYKDFLEKLGVDCENYRKIAPDSIQLALNWDAVSRATAKPKSKTSIRAFSSKSRDTWDEVQTRFLSKMKKNHRLIEKALQAFDIKESGFVSQEDLRSVISNFLFPIDEDTFNELLNRFSVSSTEPVDWRTFLGLFKDDMTLQNNSAPATVGTSRIEAILSKLHQHVLNQSLLTETFLDFDKNRSGFISRDELRRALESQNVHLNKEQFTILFDVLDVEHTDAINYQQFLDFLHQQQPVVQTQNLNKKVSSRINTAATTTQNAIEEILKDKLSENYDVLIESITSTTQNQSDSIPQEDLRRLIQKHSLPLSECHFSKLCEPFFEGGNVNYKLFLKSLGIPEKAESSLSVIEREEKEHDACRLNIKAQAVRDVVLRKLKDRLQRRGMTLQDYLMSTRKNITTSVTLRDFSKILDDFGIFLEGPQFQLLVECLGFNLGQISAADFVAKYEEVTIPEMYEDRQTKNIQTSALLTAEDCLGQLKKRIKEYHGDTLTAFRFMDKNQDGLVNRNDFRTLFDSLMFVIQEREYQKLLDLFGLTPGATLNYTDFSNRVLSSGKMKSQHTLQDSGLDIACDQVHDYLANIVHKRPSELSKAFCHLGDDCKTIVTKNGLKHLLFKYYMPITPNEFEKLWCRYDEEGKGFLTQTEFLRKLKVTSDEDSQSDAVQEEPTDPQISTPDLKVMVQNLRKWINIHFESVSGSLVVLDKNKDGHVTVTDLRSLLYRHGFQLTETQLMLLLNLLGFDASVKELRYLDFLKSLSGPVVSSGPGVDSHKGPSVDSVVPVEDVEEMSPERAIQRVKELVTASSDTLFKAFSAFDKTEAGMISQAEFRQVLDHFCMCLSAMQFRKLLAEMKISEGEEMVDWKEFLQVFNLHNQETADEWLKKIHKMRFPNQIRPLAINDIVRRIQEVVSARIYTITKEMVDLDYAKINMISKTDFKTICDRHFMRLTDDQFQNLWKMLPVNGFGNLEYREFLKKFSGDQKGLEKVANSLPGSARSIPDRPTSLKRPKTAPCALRRSTQSSVSERIQRPSTASRRSTPLLNCEDVEMKVRPKIQDCWRNIQRKCRQADQDRTGEIDVETFLEILQGLHIDLSPPEFQQLAVKYDIRNSGRVSYPDFLRHFVLMFSPQVNTSAQRLRLQLPRTPMSPGPISAQCAEAMLRISRPIQLFWRQMRQKFISFDKERTGKISLQDFRKVLRQYSVNLSEEEFFHFTSFFDKNLSGIISYNDFLRIFLK